MYHYVEFHSDEGQMCGYGRRTFTDPETASRFADKMRAVPGHTCTDSVRELTSETDLGSEGFIYPFIANMARHLHS